ncbi:MAG: DUF934 domain-containing protein [Pseudomonadota bacterium]|nr:DUF934 domain-containing protein [Pseudomonadota bacterium]
MPTLLDITRGGTVRRTERSHRIIEEAESAVDLPDGPILVPLALWLAAHGELRDRADLGVWLAPDDEPEALAPALEGLNLIAVRFPVFTDGRGLSSASLLRARLGFTGTLRAVGDVLRDLLVPMRRCGFDSFALRDDVDVDTAVHTLETVAHYYQGDILDPRPLFRRVDRTAPDEKAPANAA